MSKDRNYWPIGLSIFGACFIMGLAYVIFVAVKNPVEMDSSHMMSYRDFDNNYNEIMESQKKFDQNYSVEIGKLNIFKDKPASLELNISSKVDDKALIDANITALITRPDTRKHDIIITEFNKTNNTFVSKPFSVPLEGRWKVIYKLEVGGVQKFVEFETFANRAAK